jgi:hypothetical protein
MHAALMFPIQILAGNGVMHSPRSVTLILPLSSLCCDVFLQLSRLRQAFRAARCQRLSHDCICCHVAEFSGALDRLNPDFISFRERCRFALFPCCL